MINKQILLTCLLTASFAIGAKAQSKIVYAYDNAGNRVERTIILTKSAQAEDPGYFKEELGEQIIKIYPNPTDGQFAVEIINVSDKVSGKFYLYDIKGGLLEKKEINSERRIEFDLSDKAVGVYLLKIHLGENVSTWKIIKK